MSQSGTLGASAVRIVKREKTRLEFRHRNSAIRTGILLRKEHFRYRIVRRFLPQYHQRTARTFQCSFHRFRKPLAYIGGQLNAINDNFNRMLFLLIELNAVFKVDHQSIDTRAQESRFLRIFNDFLMFAFFPLDNRRKNLNTGAIFPAHNSIDDLVNCLFLNFLAALRTMRMPCARKKEPVVVVNLRYRTDRRARVSVCRLLFYRDSGR